MEKWTKNLPKKVNIKLDKRSISVLVSAALSLVIFVMGLVVFCNAGKLAESIYVGTTYASSYSFGADFYTEMFQITYKAVDQLNNIANGISSGFGRVLTALRAVAKGVGVLVMALGLYSLNRSVPALVELLPEKKTKPENETETVEVTVTTETVHEIVKTCVFRPEADDAEEAVQEETDEAQTL